MICAAPTKWGFFIGYHQRAGQLSGVQLGGQWGVPLQLPPLPALMFLRSGKLFMSQLDKLKEIAAQESKLIKHEIEIKGQDLTFWSKPLTIAEYQAAKKASKDPDDLLESTARLFIQKALDANGQRQYQVDALPVLMRVLSMSTAAKLMGAMNEEEEEETSLDMKSAEKRTKS